MKTKVLAEQIINLTIKIEELKYHLDGTLPRVVDGVVKKEVIRLEKQREELIDES